MIVTWDDKYSVNVSEIDNQHKKLVDLINKLHDAMKQGKSKEVLSEIISELINYTDVHFKTEEKYFDKFNYPKSDAHKTLHKNFVDKVLDFKNKYESGNAALSIEIINFLKDWLINHINGSDKEYSSFFNEHGLK